MAYNGKSIKKFTPDELVQRARDNHIWLSAFSCIRPTDKFKTEVADMILAKLEETDMSDDLGISPTIILTINKS